MNTLAVVLTCVDIVVCIALIILVMSQEGNDQADERFLIHVFHTYSI